MKKKMMDSKHKMPNGMMMTDAEMKKMMAEKMAKKILKKKKAK